MIDETIGRPWQFLSGARKSTDILDGHTDPDVPYMAYGTTWDTSSPSHAAQNPAKFPKGNGKGDGKGIPRENEVNAILLMFLVSDTADDEVAGTLWTRHGEGPAYDLATFNPIKAGTAVCEVDLNTPRPLRHLAFTSGSQELITGDKITGGTSAATAVIDRIHKTSGTYADGDQAGTMYLDSIVGTFQSETLNTQTVEFSFESGNLEIKINDVIKGGTSGAFAKVTGVVLETGSYQNSDATGKIFVTILSGTFQAEAIGTNDLTALANIYDPAFTNVATVGTDIQDFRYADAMTASPDRTGGTIPISGLANGMAIAGPIDLRGATHFWFDWDIDLAGGTNGIDGLCYFLPY